LLSGLIEKAKQGKGVACEPTLFVLHVAVAPATFCWHWPSDPMYDNCNRQGSHAFGKESHTTMNSPLYWSIHRLFAIGFLIIGLCNAPTSLVAQVGGGGYGNPTATGSNSRIVDVAMPLNEGGMGSRSSRKRGSYLLDSGPVRSSLYLSHDPKSLIALKLSEPVPIKASGKILIEDLVLELNEIGIPARIDREGLGTAGIDESVELDVPATGNIADSLAEAFRERNLTFTFFNNYLVITTKEEADSHLLTVVYDVTGVAKYSEALLDAIQTSIEPDSWEENGGVGTIERLTANGRTLMPISATYLMHREVEKFLADIVYMSGGEQIQAQLRDMKSTGRLGSQLAADS
jgi:hypothetical protein